MKRTRRASTYEVANASPIGGKTSSDVRGWLNDRRREEGIFITVLLK
jgi:hypothetical protein